MLGSFHALRPQDYPLPSPFEDAINQSERFLFEFDPHQDAQFDELLKKAACYPPGTNVKAKINPNTYAYLDKISKVPPKEWIGLKPWAIATLVLRHPGYEKVRHYFGIEGYVQRRAAKHRGGFGGLETPAEHVRVLADMQDIESEVYLLQALVYADQGPKEFEENVAAWKAGDVNRLYSIESARMKEAPSIYWRLLDRRNANWMPRIDAAIKAGKPTMIVVGALHFAGPHGLLAMLKGRGYQVEQL